MIALMKSGYIHENGNETDPYLVRYVENEDMIIGHFLSTDDDPHDHHTFEVDAKYNEIEGTEKQIPPIPLNFKASCKICHLQDYTGNKDLDSDYHHGFTIGRGTKMYFMLIWHRSGNVTCVAGADTASRRVFGDTMVTIHYRARTEPALTF